MSTRPPAPALFTRGLSSLSQSSNPDSANVVGSPAETRDDAKRNMLKAMRALPIQNVWEVWFDRYAAPPPKTPTSTPTIPSLPRPPPPKANNPWVPPFLPVPRPRTAAPPTTQTTRRS